MCRHARTPPAPIVGVTGPDTSGAIAWWFTRRAVLAAGGRPVRIRPSRPRPDLTLDALILGGGAHVTTPGMPLSIATKAGFDPARDELELARLHEAMHDEVPVLGICRGAQLLNVYAGGSLLRDLAPQYGGRLPRTTARARRPVCVVSGSRLHAAVGCERFPVNCLHRHAVGRLGRGLRVVAEDAAGVVQAIEHVEHPWCLGVQWHPEYLPHVGAHRSLFAALVRAARAGSSGRGGHLQQRDAQRARPHDPAPVSSSHRARHDTGPVQASGQGNLALDDASERRTG